MEVATSVKNAKINHWLPYWAVFQYDLHSTLQSWVYRFWVLASVLAGVGYSLYRLGVYREAHIVQEASVVISDLLRWTVLGSVTLIVVLTAGCISTERGTMADSVLSRGISRYQYFLGKWHARLVAVVGTYLVMALAALLDGVFLLHEDLSLTGSLMALVTVAALLAAVVTCGVSVSAIVNSTVLGIAALWILLYGGGFLLSLLPAHYPSPHRALTNLPQILQGYYDVAALGRLMGWASGLGLFVALVGLVYFSRRDV